MTSVKTSETARALELAAVLMQQGVGCVDVCTASPDDPNTALREGGLEALQAALQSAQAPADLAAEQDYWPAPLFAETPLGLIYRRGGYNFLIESSEATPSGWFVLLSMRKSLALDGPPLHQDKIALWNAARRAQFAKASGVKEAARWLLEIGHQLSSRHHFLPRQEAPDMSEEERAEAMAFLTSPDIFNRIVSDLSKLGIVGEEKNKLLAYIAAVSRKRPKPVHLVALGQTCGGKTRLLRGILELVVPEEDWEPLTYLSARAIHYSDVLDLQHKIILVEEVPEAKREEQEQALRQLMSEGQITSWVAEKTESGHIETRRRKVKGPFAIWTTTNNPLLLDEQNLNRSFEMVVDETLAQTARIHHQQAAEVKPSWKETEAARNAITALHRNAQRLLQPLDCYWDWIDIVTFPSSQLRTRRDWPRFIELGLCIPILLQHQREKVLVAGEPGLLFQPEDYDVLYSLCPAFLAASLGEVKGSAQTLLRWLQANRSEAVFTVKDPQEGLGWSEREARRSLKQLLQARHVVELEARGARGLKQYELRSGEYVEEFMQELLTPEEVRSALAEGAN